MFGNSSRRYTSIAISQKMYKMKNPSILQVHFEKSEAEGKNPIAIQADVGNSKGIENHINEFSKITVEHRSCTLAY